LLLVFVCTTQQRRKGRETDVSEPRARVVGRYGKG
jgi:hypothetical protein